MFRAFQHVEKFLLGLSVVVLLFVGVRSSDRLGALDRIADRNPIIGGQPAPYEFERARLPDFGQVTWPAAPAQSTGPEWVYDVFTPPVIYYNSETREFTVTPPEISAPVVAQDDAPFEVELVDVRQDPYRIQLKGYFQDPRDDSYLATFQFLEAGGRTAVGRSGQKFEEEEFTLLSLQVLRTTTTSEDSMPVVEPVAVAMIIDHRTGREETLTNRETKMLPRLQGVLRVRTMPPQEVIVREGGAVEVNDYGYVVTQLALAPKQAVITRRPLGSLGTSETRTLIPLPEASTLPSGSSRARMSTAPPPSF